MDNQNWSAFELDQLQARRADGGQSYLPFLQKPSLHCGVYHLKKGSKDPQSPHQDDEVYFVESGRGRFHVDGEEVDVKPGSVLFVKAGIPHHFFDIQEDLEILVFFSTGPSDFGSGKDEPE